MNFHSSLLDDTFTKSVSITDDSGPQQADAKAKAKAEAKPKPHAKAKAKAKAKHRVGQGRDK